MLGLRYDSLSMVQQGMQASNSLILTYSSEAMLLGERLGVQSQVLADIINSSTGRCWSSEVSLLNITLQCRVTTSRFVAYDERELTYRIR